MVWESAHGHGRRYADDPNQMTTNQKAQPMQPVIKGDNGQIHFRGNAVIRYIVDHAGDVVHPGAPAIDPDTSRPFHQGCLDLGKLLEMDFPQEDLEQFAQLMGYSIRGYHELSYVSDKSCAEASVRAEQVESGAGGCRDLGCSVHGGPLFTETGKRLV
jgi:hypothetical protein